jgi:hypothetical protein
LHQVTDIDFVLDDVCRMDFLSYFSNLKTLTLINQGITEIEVSQILNQDYTNKDIGVGEAGTFRAYVA